MIESKLSFRRFSPEDFDLDEHNILSSVFVNINYMLLVLPSLLLIYAFCHL